MLKAQWENLAETYVRLAQQSDDEWDTDIIYDPIQDMLDRTRLLTVLGVMRLQVCQQGLPGKELAFQLEAKGYASTDNVRPLRIFLSSTSTCRFFDFKKRH